MRRLNGGRPSVANDEDRSPHPPPAGRLCATPPHQPFIDLQRTAGNAAVARLVASGGIPLQRHSGPGEELDETAVQRQSSIAPVVQRKMHDRYNRQWAWAQQEGVLSANQVTQARTHVTNNDPKDDVLGVVSLSNFVTSVVKDKKRRRQIQALVWKHLVENGFDIGSAKTYRASLVSAKRAALTGLVDVAASSARLRTMPGTIYRNPPLDQAAGRAALGQFALGNVNALAGLQGALESYGPDDTYQSPIEHEWGLGEAKDGTGECFIVVGDRTGVDWGTYLPYLTPVAHAHPYFGKAPKSFGGPGSAATKVIGGGGFMVQQLDGMGGHVEALKVLPSAGDVKFCADKGFATHTVYTPYVYVDNPQPAIVNPRPALGAAPRVEFDIVNATAAGAAGRYTCQIVARAADGVIWQKNNVTADTGTGGGGLGTLRW